MFQYLLIRNMAKLSINITIVNRPSSGSQTRQLMLTFFVSLTGLPIIYLFNYGFSSVDASVRPFWMMISGFVLFAGIFGITISATKRRDWVYFGMTVFAFTSVIDAIIPLESLGIVDKFMSEYLKFGEPYLLSSWGSAICCFDATVFYSLYLTIVYFHTNNKNWRSVGLYWAAALLNSMLVLVTGIFSGKHSPTFCILLNIPYIFFPIMILFRIFRMEKRSEWTSKNKGSVLLKVFDAFLFLGFLASVWIILAKTLTVLGNRESLVVKTVKHEPTLLYDDPAPFYPIQVLVFYFYIIPVQLMSLWFLCQEEKRQFLWDVTLMESGAMLQAQFSYILYSFHSSTPPQFRAEWTNQEFWINNFLLILVPHLFLLRLSLHRKSSDVKHPNKKQ